MSFNHRDGILFETVSCILCADDPPQQVGAVIKVPAADTVTDAFDGHLRHVPEAGDFDRNRRAGRGHQFPDAVSIPDRFSLQYLQGRRGR